MIDVNKILQNTGLRLNPMMALDDIFDDTDDICAVSGESCPCEEAKKLQGSTKAEACPAKLFCTSKYLAEMNLPRDAMENVSVDEPAEAEVSEEDMKAKAMKFQGLFDEVGALVEDEEYTEALDRIKQAMENETCELCLSMLMAEANRIATVAGVCSLPSESACRTEKEVFNTRFKSRLQEITEVVNEIGEFTAETKPKSPFHACVSSTVLTDDQRLAIEESFLEARRHSVEHGIKSRMCGQAKNTFEEALQYMKDGHPDWLIVGGEVQ